MVAQYRFADITLDTGRRCASRGDAESPLGKLSYKLLALLVETAPQVVAPEDMAQRLWHGRYVSRNTVKQRVKLLRDALDDDAHDLAGRPELAAPCVSKRRITSRLSGACESSQRLTTVHDVD
jgi:DNA-binding winged helix-turn-helix (wHTH) protein